MNFEKTILVISILLLLVYLYNVCLEGSDNNEQITFFLTDDNVTPSFVSDSLMFPVAKILTKVNRSDGTPGGVLKHTPIYSDDDITSSEPYYIETPINGKPYIELHNVNYVSSIIDNYSVFCPSSSNENIPKIIDDPSTEKLFNTRIVCFVKIKGNGEQNQIKGDIRDIDKQVSIAKLKWDDGQKKYEIKYLDGFDESDKDPDTESDTKYALYIYEGLDMENPKSPRADGGDIPDGDDIAGGGDIPDGDDIAGGDDTANIANIMTHAELKSLNCKTLIDYFGKRIGTQLGTSSPELQVTPKYKHQKKIDYIYYSLSKNNVGDNFSEEDKNKFLSLIMTDYYPRLIKESVKLNSSLLVKRYYKILKKNLIMFHIHLTQYTPPHHNMLEYITFDLNTKNNNKNNNREDVILQKIRQIPDNQLKEKLKNFYSLNAAQQTDGGMSENVIMDTTDVVRIIYKNNSDDDDDDEQSNSLQYLRVPDFTHLCGSASDYVDILRKITLEFSSSLSVDDGGSLTIKMTNTCTDNTKMRGLKNKLKVDQLDVAKGFVNGKRLTYMGEILTQNGVILRE